MAEENSDVIIGIFVLLGVPFFLIIYGYFHNNYILVAGLVYIFISIIFIFSLSPNEKDDIDIYSINPISH